MFSSSEKIYRCITFTNYINNPTISEVKENRLDGLNKLIGQCDLTQVAGRLHALKFAQKMSVFHGVPGLLHYVKIQLQILTNNRMDSQEIGSDSFNVLFYLNLARLIAQSEGGVSKDVVAMFPNDNFSDPNYWDNEISKIARFGNVQDRKEEAAELALDIFSSDSPPKSEYK